MPNTFSPPNICPAVLTSLSDNLINNPANINIFGGTLAALNDPTNTGAGQIIRSANDDGTGHTKEVRVVFKKRLLPAAVVDEFDCTVGDELPYIEQVITVDKYKAINFSMSEATVRQLCASYSELVRLTGTNNPQMIVGRANAMGAATGALSVAREIFGDFQLAANALIQAVNADLLTSILGGVGSIVGGTAGTAVSYDVQNTDGSVNAGGLFQFKQDYIKTGLNGTPFIIGGAGALHQIWMNDSRFFGQAANGINFATVRDNTGLAQFFYDQNAAGVLAGSAADNENLAVVIAPGSAIYTPFLQYVGNFGKIGNTERFTMPLPQLPQVKCDVRIQPIECGTNANSYSVWMEMYYDVYTPPTNMFPAAVVGPPAVAGDSLAGVNGLYLANFN